MQHIQLGDYVLFPCKVVGLDDENRPAKLTLRPLGEPIIRTIYGVPGILLKDYPITVNEKNVDLLVTFSPEGDSSADFTALEEKCLKLVDADRGIEHRDASEPTMADADEVRERLSAFREGSVPGLADPQEVKLKPDS